MSKPTVWCDPSYQPDAIFDLVDIPSMEDELSDPRFSIGDHVCVGNDNGIVVRIVQGVFPRRYVVRVKRRDGIGEWPLYVESISGHMERI